MQENLEVGRLPRDASFVMPQERQEKDEEEDAAVGDRPGQGQRTEGREKARRSGRQLEKEREVVDYCCCSGRWRRRE
jgi:hypothetical protein